MIVDAASGFNILVLHFWKILKTMLWSPPEKRALMRRGVGWGRKKGLVRNRWKRSTNLKVFPLSKFISHAYPLSFVQVKSQSRRTMDAFLLRWIGEGVPPVAIPYSCLPIEFCTSQLPNPQDNGCVIPAKMKIPGSDLDWQYFFCQDHIAWQWWRCSPCCNSLLMPTHWVLYKSTPKPAGLWMRDSC
jgi:hypothetical protein